MERRKLKDRRLNAANNGLPINATAAIQRMIMVSQKLVDISERETQALIQRDMLAFAIIQDEKESISAQYTKASEEFRTRIEDFRNVEKNLIDRLELLQRNLSEKTHGNNAIVNEMQRYAENTAQKTLIAAQEYGQQKRVRFMNTNNGGIE